MSAEPKPVAVCDACGAMIYEEHMRLRSADRWAGKLLCPVCLAEKRGGPVAEAPPGAARELRRAPTTQPGLATRCRSFHAKLTDAALAHMNAQVNDWLEQHPDYFVKFATSSVGVVEGKHSEPHLVLTVFY